MYIHANSGTQKKQRHRRRSVLDRLAATAIFACAILAFALTLAASQSQAATTVKVIDYKGWSGCYELSNGIARIVVVPQAGGRIMEYSVDGQNVLWQNPNLIGTVEDAWGRDWVNYGGYKIWNAPQDRWNWPPDVELDNMPCRVVTVSPTGIKIIGEWSSQYGIRFVKEVYLASDSSRAVISQRMYSNIDQPAEWSIWDVTQVVTPGMAALPVNSDSQYPGGLRSFGNYSDNVIKSRVDIDGGIAVITHLPGRDLKFGADSPAGWAAYTTGNLLFIKRYPNPVEGESYPDGGLNGEVYLSGDLGYVEVEVLGPMTKLSKGGYCSFNEEWVLIKLAEPVRTPDEFRKALAAHAGELRGFAK